MDYALANHNVDVNRMYIGGFSSGSLESWAIAKGQEKGRGIGVGGRIGRDLWLEGGWVSVFSVCVCLCVCSVSERVSVFSE